jgi:hypothetical protein
LAGRTWSSELENMVVRPCHVEWVVRFIRSEYDKPSHGYRDYSLHLAQKQSILNTLEVTNRLWLLPNPKDVISHLLVAAKVDAQDFCNWCGWMADQAEQFIGVLVRNNALVRDGREYIKSGEFTKLLRKLHKEPGPKVPDHVTLDVEMSNPYDA